MVLGMRKRNDSDMDPPPPANTGDVPFPQGKMSEQYPYPDQQSKPYPPSSGLPVDQVLNLRQQGLSNNQIVQTLQRDGYDSGQIFDAMNQADMQGGAGGPIQFGQTAQQSQPQQQDYAYNQGMGQESSFNQMPPPDAYSQDALPPTEGMPPLPGQNPEVARIEEIAEAIIDEKWEELIKSINKILEWKDSTEAKMSKLEQQFADLKESFNNLHTAVVGKIGEYDRNILNVGTEIKAMEKVFQKILPAFTENVSELSRLTRNIKASSRKGS